MTSGVLVVDKPRGPTSFGVVDSVRRARGARKAGHAGTLDPMATGVLVLCLEEATKLVPFLVESDKEYRAEAQLGVETDTQDADGRETARRNASAVRAGDVAAALATFVGRIRQRPPMYSAVKVGGRRLHEAARAGEEVERAEREVEVREAALEAYDAATARATIRVVCSKGTYVRTLAADLGAKLGVGAHLTALRRLRSGSFSIEAAVAPDAAAGAPLVSPARALAHLPQVAIDADAAARMRRGGHPPADTRASDGRFALVAPGDDLVAVAESAGGRVRLLRVLHAK